MVWKFINYIDYVKKLKLFELLFYFFPVCFCVLAMMLSWILTGNGLMKEELGVWKVKFEWVLRVELSFRVVLWGYREGWWIMWKSWLDQLDWACDDYFEMRYGREILSLRVFIFKISWDCDFNFLGLLKANGVVTCVKV